jgi:hypothetical protein
MGQDCSSGRHVRWRTLAASLPLALAAACRHLPSLGFSAVRRFLVLSTSRLYRVLLPRLTPGEGHCVLLSLPLAWRLQLDPPPIRR